MSVPKQALEQLERAEKALEPIKDTSSEETVVTQEQGNDENLSSNNEETQEVSPQETSEALQRELELERQRNASLKGRIESQLKTANSENKELKTQLMQIQEKMSELEMASKEPGNKRHISKEEAEELGDDVLDLQTRVIKGTIEEELERGKIKEYVEQLINKSIEVRSEQPQSNPVDVNAFWETVEKFYPGARALNTSDTGWFAFLNLYDSKSGLKNRDLGADAINNADVATLVDLLNAYKPLSSAPNNSTEVSPKPETTNHARNVELPQKPVFTKANVNLFYKDLADGRFKGTKGRKEAEEIEAQIMEAAQEGRIY
jgi:hypothetical protein|tara:strand:+ start:5338 stop:6291 length:954 start_codon:yes stop_codon:yes gene_type:complete